MLIVTKKDIDAQCVSVFSSTLVQVVENGTKTGITINPVTYQPFGHIERLRVSCDRKALNHTLGICPQIGKFARMSGRTPGGFARHATPGR